MALQFSLINRVGFILSLVDRNNTEESERPRLLSEPLENSGSRPNYFLATSSLNFLPAEKAGTVLAAIFSSLPV
jgi:hypothetical protein